MSVLRELMRWVWLTVCLIDGIAAILGWIELRQKKDRSFNYLSRILLADAIRAFLTTVGLYLFGVNVQANLWYLVLGLFSVCYQGTSTVGWLLYIRGIINGGGFIGLIMSLFKSKKKGGNNMSKEREEKDREKKEDGQEYEGGNEPEGGQTTGGPDPEPDPGQTTGGPH